MRIHAHMCTRISRSRKLKLVALRGSVVDGSTASETMGADLRRRPGAGRDATRGTSTASSRAPRGVAASRVKARPSGSRADRILGRRTGRPLGRRPFTTRASGAREEGVHGIQEAASADVSVIYKRFIKVRETTTIAWLLGCAAFSVSLALILRNFADVLCCCPVVALAHGACAPFPAMNSPLSSLLRTGPRKRTRTRGRPRSCWQVFSPSRLGARA